MHVVTPAPGTFTPQELERLAVYRAAVEAGFYSDEVPGHGPRIDVDLPTDLTAPDPDVQASAKPSATSDVPGR